MAQGHLVVGTDGGGVQRQVLVNSNSLGTGGGDMQMAAISDLVTGQAIGSATNSTVTKEQADWSVHAKLFSDYQSPVHARDNGLQALTVGSGAQFSMNTADGAIGESLRYLFARIGKGLYVLLRDAVEVDEALRVGDVSRAKAGITRLIAGTEGGNLAVALTGGFSPEPARPIPNS